MPVAHGQHYTSNGSYSPPSPSYEKLATALGWFSVGLGAAEILFPGQLANLIGVGNKAKTRALLRTYGVRELAAGIGILSQSQPTGWLWSRVAGDAVDLASLGAVLGSAEKGKLGTAIAAVAGVTALDILCGQQLSKASSPEGGRTRIVGFANINRTPADVYGYWRNFDNLPNFMTHLQSVRSMGDQRSQWRAQAGGTTFEWQAEVVDDEPGRLLSWRSLPGSEIQNSGTVRFEAAPGGRGTRVTVEIVYTPPGGKIGPALAKLVGQAPSQQLERDLRALKSILEAGEVVKSDASIHPGMHAAQPPDAEEIQQQRHGSETLSPSMA